MPSTRKNGKCGGPTNLQKNAVSTPSTASEHSKKLTTGSRITSRSNAGTRIHCQRMHRTGSPAPGAHARASVAEADVILLFAPNRVRLQDQLPAVLERAPHAAILWVAYPKLTSPLAADLSRDIIHSLVPSHGLDTVSQIAIDDDWSALRLKRLT